MKSAKSFESPTQSKEGESTPEEMSRDQPDVTSEAGFPESTYNLGEAASRGNVPVTPGQLPIAYLNYHRKLFIILHVKLIRECVLKSRNRNGSLLVQYLALSIFSVLT